MKRCSTSLVIREMQIKATREVAIKHGELNLALCDNLETWDGLGVGGEVQSLGGTCVC